MPQPDFNQLFQQFASLKVAVIGDVMLDTYWWGAVDRISPEAPVPVVAVSKKEQRIGGAGNVALNVRSLGASVSILSMLGDDEDSRQLVTLLKQCGIDTSYLLFDKNRITTNKIRIISRNQQMMRLDAEITMDLSERQEEKLLTAFKHLVATEKPDIVIMEDYNKGILTQKVITAVIDICKENRILTAVDPKRKNFFAYREVDIFKPNWKEVKEGLNIISDEKNIGVLKKIHIQLSEQLHHSISLITLSEKGVFYQQQEDAHILPTHIRNIADVSGAGDTVIAVASLVFAATKDKTLMAEIANIAGGLVCEEVGTVAIDAQRLKEECIQLLN